MSFYPLPTEFLTDLTHPPSGCVVELGSGDGRLSSVMRSAGAAVVTVDRTRSTNDAEDPAVLADAEQPPLRGVRILVVANLLRHLWSPDAFDRLIPIWINCLAPGGWLYILEDEPATTPGPADTYRRLQDLLARIVPWRRGLLSRDRFEARLERSTDIGGWSTGLRANQFTPPDPSVVISLLQTNEGGLARDAKRLVEEVSEVGIEYGEFWWARYERERA